MEGLRERVPDESTYCWMCFGGKDVGTKEWMDRWMDRWMDGWMNGGMNKWIDRWMDGLMN